MSGWVYIIGGERTGLAKIGFTKNPPQRFLALRVASPVPLLVLYLADATWFSERELHRRFDHLRERDEWFRLVSGNALDIFIAEQRQDWEMVLHCDDFNEGGFYYELPPEQWHEREEASAS